MAQRKAEVWLTSVMKDELVDNAVVLAESLRKTKTTRIIAAIASRSLSADKGVALRQAFDSIFYMDDTHFPNNSLMVENEELRAKIFVLSLHFFQKCVFISPKSLVLENMDSLFEGTEKIKVIRNAENGSIDLSLFVMSPRQDMWKCLWESLNGNMLTEDYLCKWLKTQQSDVKSSTIPDQVLAKFSVKSGKLIKIPAQPSIIQFIDVSNAQKFALQIGSLNKANFGILEKLITAKWSEIYGDVLELIENPTMTRSLDSFSNTVCYYENEPIAIVGMSCRYPGANNVEEFWNMLYRGDEGVREPPAFRWTKEHSLRVTQQERKTNAGFLATTVDEFDAKFFGVSPKEAAYMDPQARLLHEVVWESLEDSGIDPLSLYGTHTGIFTGSWMNDYKDIVQWSTERDFFRTYMGNSIGAAAARLSFLLGLTGPSIATESGCSSAIVALDLAVKSLRSGESNLAVAGGVNLLLHPFTSNIMDYVIAPNGRCKTFDSKADGFGRAEGCGVLVLKRMSDALRDRDNIWALIRGSAVSQEGLSRSLGTPTVHCEALAMQLALKDANVKPSQVSFVETHGTGTAVGDPMEVAAIAKAYYSPYRKEPLVIGSVKTNVGHTESCSGITGIMKTVLALQHELIPKHRNLESLNPEIFLDSIPAIIPLESIPWPKVHGQPRIAGVSSFGITGTDGHAIIQEAPDYELPKFTWGLERPTHIMKISGKSSEALEEMLKAYENLFSERGQNGDDTFANAAYSANIGRAPFNHRTFIIGNNYQDAVKALQENQYLCGEVKDGETHQICFLFTGQGSQYQGMAKRLYDTSPVFRINFDFCDRTLQEMYNLSIRQVLWESNPLSKELSRTIYSQTSIFCIEYCLLKLWTSWGIHPDYVLGHSLGEFAAAVAAGILDFKDALKLVAERSRLIDNLPHGSMLVIKASKPEVEKLMKSSQFDLDFAAVNNPEQTVVAGDTQNIESFLGFLKGQGIKATILEATHAFHSRHMDPILEQYRKIAHTTSYTQGNSNIQYVSGMEGRIISDVSEINADYWVRHTREKVSFLEACATLREASVQEYLEIGPQPILSSFVMMNSETIQMTCFPSLRRGTDDWNTILTSLGKLYLLGYKVDWHGFDKTYIRNKVSLPFHPFNRKSFWVECNSANASMIHPLVGYSMNNASTVNIFQNDLRINSVPYLKDHCIGSRMVFPGAGYTEMCLAAGYIVANGLTDGMESPRRPMQIDNLRIDAPLELKEGKGCRLQVIVDLPESNGLNQQSDNDNNDQKQGFRVKIFHQNTSSDDSSKWVLHASSTFIPVASTKDIMRKWNPERIKEIMSTVEHSSSDAVYKRADETGLKFGETFKRIQRHWNIKSNGIDADEVVAQISLPEDHAKYILHPLIIDAAFQVGILTGTRYDQNTRLKVPIRIGSLTLLNAIEQDVEGYKEQNLLYAHVWPENGKYYGFLASQNFVPIAYLEDMEMIDTNVRTIESVLEQQYSSIPDAWEEVWRPITGPFSNIIELAPIKPVLSQDGFQRESNLLSQTSPDDTAIVLTTNRLLYLYVLNALYELGWQPRPNDSIDVNQFCDEFNILPNFRQLVHYYFTVFEEDENVMEYNQFSKLWRIKSLPPSEIKAEMEQLTNLLTSSSSSTVFRIYEHISKLLSKILKGDESVLPILFPTDEDKQHVSADQYYQNHPGRNNTFGMIGHYMHTIFKCHMLANDSQAGRAFRILEVGSGTGSLTATVLSWLREHWDNKFEYYYTDISQSFFAKAEKKFEECGGNIKYAVFNIEDSPLSQGIPLNYFDFVVATDVLHATRNLQESLVHIRQTMRPGATLCFSETIIAARDITFVFGLLDGYWRFEDFQRRPHHTCVNEQVWSEVLEQSGFKSVHSSKAYAGTFGVVAAEAAKNVDPFTIISNPVAQHKRSWILFCTGDDTATHQVANILSASGANVEVVFKSSDDAVSVEIARKTLNSNICTTVIPAEFEDPTSIEAVFKKEGLQGIIYAWAMDTNAKDQKQVALPFMNIAKWILVQRKPPALFILTHGVHSINESLNINPTTATIFGMVKSLKNENNELFVRYIDLEAGLHDSRKAADEILYELVMCKGVKDGGRVQIAYRNSQRYEPKFVKAILPTKHDELQLPPSSDRYHLVLPATRLIHDVTFDADDSKDVGENEIEVKVKAYALNFRDIFAILKPSKEFESINSVGLDYSGVVVKVGSGHVAGKCKVGDRVFGANFNDNLLSSHLVVNASSMLRIPEKMTYWEASTLPAVFATAYYCLLTVANMKKGDTVLIHTGSGGVGLAAIQLAKHVGATIITTAGNPRKRAYLRSLGIEHVFHSRNTLYEHDIMRVTNGRGVDIVLNSITGPGFKEATLACCAQNARFIEMSKLTIWSPEEVKALRADVNYSIVDLTNLEHAKWTKLLANMTEFLEQGSLKPIPYVKFDALHIRQALQFFQKAKHVGKVVCVMPEIITQDGQIKHISPLFNDKSTYLITGGLGGIGFEVCKWVLEKGATDIVLICRSPPKPDTATAIDDLNKRGFNVMVRLGDVSDFIQCKCIADEIGRTGKPLRGVMHCAGVLRDNLYANQTWETFNATFKPKVEGTWNLHNLTKDLQLEHFVLYSSITALVGVPSQPNHAAANCFEDAFAHYRHSLGLPATSINWGQWAQVGCAKEINITGILPVSVKRMMNGLELALKTQKLQVCYSEFESFSNLAVLCPIAKSYLDEKLWKQFNNADHHNKCLVNSDIFWGEMDATEVEADKINIISSYIKLILRAGLRMESDEPIDEHANIQDLGVDSLMLIELKNSIQSLLGGRVTVTADLLKNCKTISQIATAILDKIVEEVDESPIEPLSIQELSQLVEKDCQLDAVIKNDSKSTHITKPSLVRTILITGATGQLGASVLAELSQKYANLNKIICLVRGVAGTSPEKRVAEYLWSMDLTELVDMSKIECVTGNVAQPNLGMDLDCYERLTESVDAVIHLASKTNNNEPYRNYPNGKSTDLRSVNVEGTINVLKFACDQKIKQVYFASTFICGLFGENERGTLSDGWPNSDTMKASIDARIPGLYISKLVCELLIKEANVRGIPCKVFRFPWISGHSRTGRLDVLNNLYILRYLSFLKVGAMPSLPLPANVLPIDLCADISLQLFFNDDTPFEIFNVGHPHPQVEQEFLNVAEEEMGKELEILEWKEFAERLKETDTEIDNLKDLHKDQKSMSLYIADSIGIVNGYLVFPETFFRNEKVSRFIPSFERNVQPSMEIVRSDLKYLRSTGVLEKFGI